MMCDIKSVKTTQLVKIPTPSSSTAKTARIRFFIAGRILVSFFKSLFSLYNGQILGGGGELLADRQRILQAGAAFCPFNGVFRPLGFQVLRHGAVAVDLVFYPHISARHKYGIGGGIVQRCTVDGKLFQTELALLVYR